MTTEHLRLEAVSDMIHWDDLLTRRCTLLRGEINAVDRKDILFKYMEKRIKTAHLNATGVKLKQKKTLLQLLRLH